MNKKSTFLASAFLLAGVLSANAIDFEPLADNYHYLRTQINDKSYYLSLCGTKPDSIIVKELNENEVSKAACDSALWEITAVGNETAGPVYQFKNKKTKAVLSFPASPTAAPVLGDGVSKWVISDDGKISSTLSDGKLMTLSVKDEGDKLVVFAGSQNNIFKVVEPSTKKLLTAEDLGAGFTTFQLAFNAQYEGDIFSGKDLIATQAVDKVDKDNHYLYLQVKGDESFNDGVKKYLTVSDEVTEITGASGCYGDKFGLDSIHASAENTKEAYKKFRFTVDLKDDALAMYVKNAPHAESNGVQVVYATLGNKKVLTVSDLKGLPEVGPTHGALPGIRVSRGTPATISTGSGVYFLKSASKTDTGGKYISSFNVNANKIETMEETPSVHQLKGQWYIKEDNNKYSIVDRESNSEFAMDKEIFAVQGMPNTYTFGEKTDSVTVEFQQVDLKNKYLGSLHFSEGELSDNGYILNLIPGTAGIDKLYAFTSDSILQMKNDDGKDALIFRLIPGNEEEVGGAKKLGDVVYTVPYVLQNLSDESKVAEVQSNKTLKLSNISSLPFIFLNDATGKKYIMKSANDDGNTVSLDVKTSNLILSSMDAYFTLEEVSAPQYASFESSHKQISFDGRSLTMNPTNFFAELKETPVEGLKSESVYEYNFSLWVEKAEASKPGKSLYFIASSRLSSLKADSPLYYMVSGRSANLKDPSGNVRVNFVQKDDIKTMKDSPALFAFKTAEDGGYYLENQQELNNPADQQAPYVGYVNGYLVMQKEPGAVFTVENTSIPTSSEEINTHAVKVIGNVGSITITNANGKKISLSNVLGQPIDKRLVDSDHYVLPLSRGLVIVSIEGETAQKAIVR